MSIRHSHTTGSLTSNERAIGTSLSEEEETALRSDIKLVQSRATDSMTLQVLQVQLEPEDGHNVLPMRLVGSRSRGIYVASVIGGTKLAEVFSVYLCRLYSDFQSGEISAGDQLLRCDEMQIIGLTAEQAARFIRKSLVQRSIAHIVLYRCLFSSSSVQM